MNTIPPKSRLRYITHNPTGRLFYILSREIKAFCIKQERKNGYGSNSSTNSTKLG